jgi:hypothetical protein
MMSMVTLWICALYKNTDSFLMLVGLIIALRPQTPSILGAAGHTDYTDTSEPVDGNGAKKIMMYTIPIAATTTNNLYELTLCTRQYVRTK